MKNNIIIHEDYAIHFDIPHVGESAMLRYRLNMQEFEVYPIIKEVDGNIHYISKENESDTLDVFDKEKALCKMSGTFCWRGVWEGRLYFTDQEYWGEELCELSNIYNEIIVPISKDGIKKRYSNIP